MNFHLELSFGLLFHLGVFIFSIFLLYKFYRFAFNSPKPSGPAAIGRGMGVLVLGEILGAYLVWCLVSIFNAFAGLESIDSVVKFLSLIIFYAASIGSGFIASRTNEDTATMNYKIQVAAGFIPNGIIGLIVFSGGIYNHLAFWPYAILVLVGGLIQIKYGQILESKIN